MKASPGGAGDGVLATNRKARFNYHVLETFEAGIQLAGTEVKSIRRRELSLEEAFAVVKDQEAFLLNMHVQPYAQGNRHNHEPTRMRRLLLHKKEIQRLNGKLTRDGLTLVPLDMHLRGGKIKVSLGLCKGKIQADKRDTIKTRESNLDARRAMRNAQRGD